MPIPGELGVLNSDSFHSAGRGGDRTSEPLPGVGSHTPERKAHHRWRDPTRSAVELTMRACPNKLWGEGMCFVMPLVET
jgi:hypothetical protein